MPVEVALFLVGIFEGFVLCYIGMKILSNKTK